MKKIMRRFSFKIVRKSRRAVSVLDRARKGLEFMKEGMRLSISY